jgi:hypothetical protein
VHLLKVPLEGVQAFSLTLRGAASGPHHILRIYVKIRIYMHYVLMVHILL